jgi:(E)-4-hydroxy-3-methylbut-2-enyl-diphosphate synthase
MTKTKTEDVRATLEQIKRLEDCGCEIVRVSVKDLKQAQAIDKLKKKIKIPLVADIHFHYELAIEAIKRGADKIRLNPGNIYKIDEIEKIVKAAKAHRIPIRVGVNSGSLRNSVLRKSSLAKAMVKSALDYIKILEQMDFREIVISLKASDIQNTVCAYRQIAQLCDYPLHLGVTAAGLLQEGIVKSSIALGILLSEGIGETMRISLTAAPEEEVGISKRILQALNLRHFYPELISCPTCGRCEVDLIKIVQALEKKLSAFAFGGSCKLLASLPKVAVMGCVVNGPGEAKEADLGIACGKGGGIFFKKGKRITYVREKDFLPRLYDEIRRQAK